MAPGLISEQAFADSGVAMAAYTPRKQECATARSHVINGANSNGYTSNGSVQGSPSPTKVGSTALSTAADGEVNDILGIGFGPAGLGIAVALHDKHEAREPSEGHSPPKMRFLERQAAFAWHPGMLLPGAKMQ